MTGKELKAARKRLGMTQVELGKALGLSSPFIGRMERGSDPIDIRTELAVSELIRSKPMLTDEDIEYVKSWFDGKPNVDEVSHHFVNGLHGFWVTKRNACPKCGSNAAVGFSFVAPEGSSYLPTFIRNPKHQERYTKNAVDSLAWVLEDQDEKGSCMHGDCKPDD